MSILKIFSEHGTVRKLGGNDCLVYDWKKEATDNLKKVGSWHFRFSLTKRFIFTRNKSKNNILVRDIVGMEQPDLLGEVVSQEMVLRRQVDKRLEGYQDNIKFCQPHSYLEVPTPEFVELQAQHLKSDLIPAEEMLQPNNSSQPCIFLHRACFYKDDSSLWTLDGVHQLHKSMGNGQTLPPGNKR
ncbi:hypothetical protein LSTR_LSTR005245 [Laodelphax striatellus]|uniref:Uncharacterized protein n=1 Tax=Laodelphax striatellus TaxID=195883 RepID=A0A482X7T2_LAOST|nr:hypothetical protein LSTR_LSTR005245 [Laodelphax striatellus]